MFSTSQDRGKAEAAERRKTVQPGDRQGVREGATANLNSNVITKIKKMVTLKSPICTGVEAASP